MRSIERVPDIFLLNVKAIDVIQPAVPRFGNDWQAPQSLAAGPLLN